MRIQKEQVYYVDRHMWIREVVDKDDDTCSIDRRGRLTVLGFSVDRGAALVRYDPPEGETGGSAGCSAGTEMFYPLRTGLE